MIGCNRPKADIQTSTKYRHNFPLIHLKTSVLSVALLMPRNAPMEATAESKFLSVGTCQSFDRKLLPN